MLAEELELKRKEDDLADCEQDYKKVTAQLRVEGDAPRQNQLEKQLKELSQKIKQLEAEIEELRRVIQQGKAQSTSDALRGILQGYEGSFADMLVACQWIFAIRKYLPSLELRSSPEIITELLKIPKGRSQQHGALELFVARLVADSQNDDLVIALQAWAEQHIQERWGEVMEWVTNHQTQSAQPAAFVVISRSDISSTQEQDGNRYQIKAWLIQDMDQYKRYRQGYSPNKLLDLTGDEAYLKEELTEKVPQLLIRLLKKGSNEFVKEPEIHIFLPLELMNQNIDCWLLDDDYGIRKPLGHEYKVVLRCAERASGSYRKRSRWVEKWRHHQSLVQEKAKAREVFTSGDDSDLTELSYALAEVEDTIVGLKVTQAPSQEKPDDLMPPNGLFGVLLQSGLPLAVWGRCKLHEPSNETELDRVLQSCCLESLPSIVKKERSQSRNKEKDCHIGHHLSLLWDDPDLLPPKSA